MRTGIEKGVTRVSAGLQKTLVDNHLAGKKVRVAMIKDISLSQVEDLSARVSHESILWEQSDFYKTKVAVRGDKQKSQKTNRCPGTCTVH